MTIFPVFFWPSLLTRVYTYTPEEISLDSAFVLSQRMLPDDASFSVFISLPDNVYIFKTVLLPLRPENLMFPCGWLG